jgi:hypothetical protein
MPYNLLSALCVVPFSSPMRYEVACQMENDLAEDLREQGYTVFGGT